MFPDYVDIDSRTGSVTCEVSIALTCDISKRVENLLNTYLSYGKQASVFPRTTKIFRYFKLLSHPKWFN